ncbi:MAG: mannonate dehydratase [Firmicutes bacterium]|nr:mannonate dehydratase [Bacillota bacterium]
MKMTFRWYGESDKVTLDMIRQIPCIHGVVTAVYDTPVGTVWAEESIKRLVTACHNKGLSCEVIESVPVHEDIKLGLATAKQYIENYKENLRRLAKFGIKCVCYNFMPVFDWLRSELSSPLEDGSHALAYNHETVLNMNPLTSGLSLPGWDESYTKEQLKELLNKYADISEERLFKNLENFLREVIPVAKEVGINMAIHPDDPPWGIFGLPRIVTGKASIKRILSAVDCTNNGITFCAGSLGAGRDNDLSEIIRIAKGRIHFAHLRNIKLINEKDFTETAHPSACGSLNMAEIVKELKQSGFNGYIRPDHGRMIWGETGKFGYGLFDRALGATYILGLWEGC